MDSPEVHHDKLLSALAGLLGHEDFANMELQLLDGVTKGHTALVAALSPALEERLTTLHTSLQQNIHFDLSMASQDTWKAVVEFHYGSEEAVVQPSMEEEMTEFCSLYQLKSLGQYCLHSGTDASGQKESGDSGEGTLSESQLECSDGCRTGGSGAVGERGLGRSRSKLQLLSKLKEFQEEGRFCDYEVHLRNATVAAIGPLMAAMSSFFFAMLTTDMTEQCTKVVSLPLVSVEVWKCIVSFYFGSEKLVTGENVMDIIECSEMYQLDDLKQYCGSFLCSKMDLDNVLEFSRLFHTYSMDAAMKSSANFIASHFTEFCKSSDFVKLTRKELIELLKNPDLVILEDDLCVWLLHWIEAAGADAGTASQVLSGLMLHRLSLFCLQTELLIHSCVKENSSLETLVREELQRRHLPAYYEPQEAPSRRGHLRSAYDLVLVCHDRWQEDPIVYCWNNQAKLWIPNPGPATKMKGMFASAVAKDCLFLTGGWSDQITHIFSVVENEWKLGPEFKEERYHHTMAVVEDVPYLVGGGGMGATLVEAYIESENSWRTVGELQCETVQFSVAAAVGSTILITQDRDLMKCNCHAPHLFQMFDVCTGIGSILQVGLPLMPQTLSSMPLAAVSRSKDAWFLCRDGRMLQVTKAASDFGVEVFVSPNGPKSQMLHAGFYMDYGWMLVAEGGPNRNLVKCTCIDSRPGGSHGFAPLPHDLMVTGMYNLGMAACRCLPDNLESLVSEPQRPAL